MILKDLKLDFNMDNTMDTEKDQLSFDDINVGDIINDSTSSNTSEEEDQLGFDDFDTNTNDTVDDSTSSDETEDLEDFEQLTFEAIDIVEEEKNNKKNKSNKKSKNNTTNVNKEVEKTKSLDDQVKELDKVQVKVFGNEIMLLEKSNNTLNDTFSVKDIQNKLIREFGYDEFAGCDVHLLIKEDNNKEGILIPTPKFFKKG